MKKIVVFFSLMFSFLACEKGYVEGVEDNDIPKEELYGGWGVTGINFQLVYNPANPIAFFFTSLHIDDDLRKKLEDKTRDVSLYFMEDTLFCIIDCNTDVERVGGKSYYTVGSFPAVIYPENKTILCDSYSDSIFIKMDIKENDTTLVLYFLKPNVMKLIREDGSVEDKHIDLIDKNIDDAQFEIYMKRNQLVIYKGLEEYYGTSSK